MEGNVCLARTRLFVVARMSCAQKLDRKVTVIKSVPD